MILPEDGRGVGSITAGCLEEEVFDVGREVLRGGGPRLERYDLMNDNDIWGLGLGCNGIIDVLLEPLNESYRPAVNAYREGQPIAVITVIEGQDGPSTARYYYRPNSGFDAVADEPLPPGLAEPLREEAERLIETGAAETLELEAPSGPVRVFVEGLVPPPEMVILGSGPDVHPLVDLAGKNNFVVTVVGLRGGQNLEQDFPDADRVVHASPANLRDKHPFDENTYAVVMTHNYVDDTVVLQKLLRTSTPYIGLMGPGERFKKMLEDYDGDEKSRVLDNMGRIYTPIGLNLGGGSPYQIAHSIVAEVLTVHNRREPTHLKDFEGPIHRRGEGPLTERAGSSDEEPEFPGVGPT